MILRLSLKVIRRLWKLLMQCFALFLLVLAAIPFCLAARRIGRQHRSRPRLVWGDAPIISNPYWARIMRDAGYPSISLTDSYCSAINSRADYDLLLDEEFRFLPEVLRRVARFLMALLRYDIFFISFNGFVLAKCSFWRLEAHLLKLAGKKVVVMPFGLDAYVYQRIRSSELMHGLMMSIPGPARMQKKIGRRVDYWCQLADAVIPGIMWLDGFGRWDAFVPSVIHVNEDDWPISTRLSLADGVSKPVRIAHAPNHRGFKGSEFVIEAVRQLQAEGVQVELLLIEGKPNSEVKRILYEEADILVEQLICPGHGLNALEGMASGLPVVCNLENDDYLRPLRRWSYFGQCPLVSAEPENLIEVLRQLISEPKLRHHLGRAGRDYIEKYQGKSAAQFFYMKVIDYVCGNGGHLIHLFHPLTSARMKELGPIDHPLKNSKLPKSEK